MTTLACFVTPDCSTFVVIPFESDHCSKTHPQSPLSGLCVFDSWLWDWTVLNGLSCYSKSLARHFSTIPPHSCHKTDLPLENRISMTLACVRFMTWTK